MKALESINELYRLYLDDKENEERKASALSKLEKLLMNQGQDNKLHAFYEAVQELIENTAKENPDSSDAAAVVDYMLDAPARYKNCLIPEIVLAAVIGHAVKLVPFIEKDDAKILMDKHFPKGDKRLAYPNQKLVYKALKKK